MRVEKATGSRQNRQTPVFFCFVFVSTSRFLAAVLTSVVVAVMAVDVYFESVWGISKSMNTAVASVS